MHEDLLPPVEFKFPEVMRDLPPWYRVRFWFKEWLALTAMRRQRKQVARKVERERSKAEERLACAIRELEEQKRSFQQELEQIEREVTRATNREIKKLRSEAFWLERKYAIYTFLRSWMVRLPDFPRFWELFAFILPRKTRERVYDPCHQELLADYLLTRRKYRTKWAKRWLSLCFTFRTFLLVAECIRVMLADKAIRFIGRSIPSVVKKWWLS